MLNLTLVKTIGQEERPQFIESFKRVRDTLKVQEQKICKSCRLNKECKLAFKLPNLRTSADLSDVLNVLTVYAQIAIELEKIYQKIPVNNLDSFEKQLEGLDKPERNQIKEKIDDLLEYSGKYKYCLQILSGVEAMIYESYDASKPLIEFTNAISFQESYIAQESSITQKKDNIPENMEKSRSKANLPANKHQFKNGKLAKDEELDYKLPLMGIASHFPRRKAAPLQKDDYVIKTKKLYRGKVKNSLLKAIDLK